MSPTHVLLLAFGIGLIAGLRTMTAPAVTAWAAHLHWLPLASTSFAFMGSLAAVAIFTLLGCFELVADKLPSTPSRLKPPGLIGRTTMGALAGATLALAGGQSPVTGAALGIVGAVAGALGGYTLRTRLVKALRTPDFVVAVPEDLVAILGGLWIVSRF